MRNLLDEDSNDTVRLSEAQARALSMTALAKCGYDEVGATIITDQLRAQMSILQQPEAVSPDFGDQVDDILAMLNGCYRVQGYDVHAVPGERTGLTPFIFGSSKGQSAQVAGANGLPFVASYHITPATALDAVDAYRRAFIPSPRLSEPYVVVSADVEPYEDSEHYLRTKKEKMGHLFTGW